MAHVVLFHSILGLRPVEREIASVFADDGHEVTLPDLFDGRTAEEYDAGFALRQEIGDAAIAARARAAIEDAPADAVLAGVSFGAFLIRHFWSDRPAMPGALLIAGVAPWMEPRRADLPVSVHIARPDPFDEEAFFADWAADAGPVPLSLHRYDGAGHYFLDRTLPDYDAQAADLCLARSLAFLRGL